MKYLDIDVDKAVHRILLQVARSKEGQQSFTIFATLCTHLGNTHLNLPIQMKISFGGLGRGTPIYLQQLCARVSRDHLGIPDTNMVDGQTSGKYGGQNFTRRRDKVS